MLCPQIECGHARMNCVESRPCQEGEARRRRYRCPICQGSYSTVELIINGPRTPHLSGSSAPAEPKAEH